MKRKIRWLVLVGVSLLCLAGWGKKRVELLSDKKLIDLNAAIVFCMPGADSAEQEENQNSQMSQEPEATVTPKPTAVPTKKTENQKNPEGEERTVIISVRERVITYNLTERVKPDKLKDIIKKDYREGADFRLVDDFAEAHVYRRVISILKELEEEFGISYTMD